MGAKKMISRSGVTLVELSVAMTIGLIVMLAVGVLLVFAHEGWGKTFREVNEGIHADALRTVVTFGSTGRKSNKRDYRLYKVSGSTFTRAVPTEPEEVVEGDAVEFRYWDEELNAGLMDIDQPATAYALIYLEDDELKIDWGAYPPGGVGSSGRRTGGNSTEVLARNVESVRFNHTTRNMDGDGQGCIRMELILREENDRDTLTVKTATLMRNVWP